MKRLLMSAVLVLAVVTVNAQYFVGGSVGFGNSKDDGGDEGVGTITGFNINPEFGYSFHERWDVGLGLGYSSETTKEEDGDGNEVDKVTESSFSVAPFVRWSAIEFGDFAVRLKGTVFYESAKQKREFPGEGVTVSIEGTINTFGISVLPVLTYDISPSFQIFADLNCFGAAFAQSKVKDGDAKATSFGIGGDSNDLLNTADFQLGFYVKF